MTEERDEIPECDLSILDINLFSDKAKWVCPEIRCYPIGWTTSYVITIDTDCPEKIATIKISATGYFNIFDQNGNKVGSGHPHPK